MNSYKTDFLTPKSSFLSGVGSVLNIGGNYFDYNNSTSDDEADEKAISMDWKIVGSDIFNSMRKVVSKSSKSHKKN